MSENKIKIYGIGLGPGDPELITLKGFQTLLKSDVIFYPASSEEEPEKSFSYQIVDYYKLQCRLQPMYFPMSGQNIQHYYAKAYNEIKEAVHNNLIVTIVSEGDLLLYSTFGYLLPYIQADKLPIKLIPGVPAFTLASANSEKILAEKNSTIKIIGKPQSFQQITQSLTGYSTLVIMKVKCLQGWYTYLKDSGLPFFYSENLGTDASFGTSQVEDLKDRDIPYFAILIIYNH